MAAQSAQDAGHATVVPSDRQEGKPGAVPLVSQPIEGEHKKTPERPRLPEQAVLRRLWRIYDMALTAANRSERTEPT